MFVDLNFEDGIGKFVL